MTARWLLTPIITVSLSHLLYTGNVAFLNSDCFESTVKGKVVSCIVKRY